MKALKIIAICFAIIFGLIITALIIIGSVAPETQIYLSHEVPKKYLKTINELELLDEDETIKYFYSDAIWKITEGMYFTTNKNLTVYVSEWEDPIFQIPLADIDSITPTYDDSFLTDSWIQITSINGEEIEFPLSSEKGRDKLFIDYLTTSAPLLEPAEEPKSPKPPSQKESPQGATLNQSNAKVKASFNLHHPPYRYPFSFAKFFAKNFPFFRINFPSK